jgi:outer membrane immunogenic protein
MSRFTLLALGVAAISPAAYAADAVVKTPAKASTASAVALNWSGPYVGVHVGGGRLDNFRFDTALPANLADHEPASLLGGAQIGFNYQAGAWVLGIEAQLSGAGFQEETPSTLFVGFTKYTRVGVLGTVAGRAGYASDDWLAYVKGGWAVADYRYEIRFLGALDARVDDTRSGWMLGVGFEKRLMNNWSWKIEYNYVDFGKVQHPFVSPVNPTEVWEIDDKIHVVKVGLNYRFASAGR